jgi:hypothetical protein
MLGAPIKLFCLQQFDVFQCSQFSSYYILNGSCTEEVLMLCV